MEQARCQKQQQGGKTVKFSMFKRLAPQSLRSGIIVSGMRQSEAGWLCSCTTMCSLWGFGSVTYLAIEDLNPLRCPADWYRWIKHRLHQHLLPQLGYPAHNHAGNRLHHNGRVSLHLRVFSIVKSPALKHGAHVSNGTPLRMSTEIKMQSNKSNNEKHCIYTNKMLVISTESQKCKHWYIPRQ